MTPREKYELTLYAGLDEEQAANLERILREWCAYRRTDIVRTVTAKEGTADDDD